MDDSPARPAQVITRIVIALAVVVGVSLVVSRPWDVENAGNCDVLVQQHLDAQKAFLNTGGEAPTQALEARNRTYAKLGTQCGWDAAQAAEAEANTRHLAAPND